MTVSHGERRTDDGGTPALRAVMSRLLPRRIYGQLMLIVTLIVIATLLAYGWVTARSQSHYAIQAMKENYGVQARNLAASCAEHLLIADYAALDAFLEMTAEQPGVIDITVSEPDGVVVSSVVRPGAGLPRAAGARAEVPRREITAATMLLKDDRLVLWQPITAGNLLGWLKISHSLDEIERYQKIIWINSALVGGAGIAVSVVLLFIALRRPVRSIQEVSAFARRLDSCKGEQLRLPPNSVEIEELSSSLNIASRELYEQESMLRDMNEELEKRIAERTAQLESSNAELQSSNAQLEAFTYSVSHDLQAPLRAMRSFSDALWEDFGEQLPPEARDYLERINRGATRMQQLVDDLLAFSRLSRLPVSRQMLHPAAMVTEIVAELREQNPGRRVDVTVGELPPCLADPVLVRQVFVNLLSNAFKYTRRREVALIEVGSRTEDGAHVYFVRDNGAGFSMEYADRLFRVFQRLHRQEEFEGTGVGLAIVENIISRHGGRVWAEAEEGKGATFYFSIPLSARQ